MSCICQIAQKVPTCLDYLILGTIPIVFPEPFGNIRVVNKSTGYQCDQTIPANEDTGLVILNLRDPSGEFYNKDSYYEITVYDGDHNVLPVTIGDLEYDCIGVYFEDVHGLEATTWVLKMDVDA